MEKDTYLSIDKKTEGIFKDKGSKFLSFAYPVSTEEEIKEIIQQLKKDHYSARHHCYAYRLDPQGSHYRANDDGEPAGTAGKPILGQLLSNDLTNILIVVVRYFGGTLLGVSGLINAYKKAAIDAISQANIVTHVLEENYFLSFDYPLQNPIMRIINDENLTLIQSTFGMKCEVEIGIRLTSLEIALGKFSKIEGLKITPLT